MAAPPLPQPEADSEAELTTRQILISGNRIRAGARVSDSEPRLFSEESADGSGHAARGSGARLAVHSSLAPVTPAPEAAPADPGIRVAAEATRLGPYHVVCELASGGMATVYLAIYRSVEGFEKLCAVKRIHPHLANDRAFTNMFADEAQIAARISHPYVCSVFSFGRTQQSHYISMEFLRGEPLSAIARRVGRSPELGDDPRFPMIAARLVANFAEGLHAAHTLRDERGAPLEVVHRDVTPQNLFVLYDGSVRVTDFGIAHARRRLHHTQGQKLKGKLSYIAPEQLSEGVVDSRVDIWGLGVTLWELLAGRRLFLGSSEGETLAAVMSRAVPAPSTYRATVPLELDRIVLRALDRDVSKRYKTARDLSRDLERFLSSLGDQVPPMDVADWMASVFPQGAERIQALVELAARVSAATADETVVRVPSAPPPRGAEPPGSFFMHAAPSAISSIPPSNPPTRPYKALPKPERTPAEPTPRSAELPLPSSAPATQSSAASRDSSDARGSKPRLVLVEEVSVERSLAQRPSAKPTWLLPALGALLVALGAGSLAAKWSGHDPGPAVTTAAPIAVVTPVAVPVVAPVVAADLPEAQPLALDDLPLAAPVAEDETLAPRAAKLAAKPRPAVSSVAPVPAPAPQVVGDVFVATPGGSGEVFEQGRLLGRAPGTFRLSVGRHELTLRTAHGTSHNLSVNVARSAATVVTVDASR